MPFEPGASGNKNGRPKGSLDKVSRRVRELITELVEENLDSIQEDFKTLSPKDRLEMISKLLPYVIPKIKMTDFEGKEPPRKMILEIVESNGQKRVLDPNQPSQNLEIVD